MAEMLINTPLAKKTVDDYDVLFESGMVMPLTVDLDAGDEIHFNDAIIKVHLASKASKNSPDKTLPAEDITIFVKHILSIQHRSREVEEQSPEERAQWFKDFDSLTGGDKDIKH